MILSSAVSVILSLVVEGESALALTVALAVAVADAVATVGVASEQAEQLRVHSVTLSLPSAWIEGTCDGPSTRNQACSHNSTIDEAVCVFIARGESGNDAKDSLVCALRVL